MSLNELFKKAVKHHLNKNYDDALIIYKKIINFYPEFAEAHNNLGLIYYEYGDKKNAVQCYLKATEINNNFIEAHTNLGGILVELGQYKKAISHCQTAIRIQPNFAKAYSNLGWAYDEIGKNSQAINYYKKSIQIDPKLVGAYNNLASLYKDTGKYDKAISFYKQAIQIDNNYYKARKNLGAVLLLLSYYDEGFEEFEWRTKDKTKEEYQDLNLQSPLWNGENLDEKIILIISEQGYGDILQFVRYIYEIQDTYKVKIIFKTYKKLIHIFGNNKFQIIHENKSIPKHDYHIYLLSLPKFYYQRKKNILEEINYIKINHKKYSFWKKKFSNLKNPKIGLCWQGGVKFKGDKHRSIPLNFFEPLFTITGIKFVNLQKGYGVEQIKDFKYRDKLIVFPEKISVDEEENAFEDTIGILQNLDLIITVDTAIAHLSSTLGNKTWLLLPFSPDWRWLLTKNTTHWYRNTRLFRQNKLNDWSKVIDKVKVKITKEFKF